MRGATALGLRKALAAAVLFGGGLAAVAIASHDERSAFATGVTGWGYPTVYAYAKPWGVIPSAVVVGLLAIAFAVLIYRSRAEQ
jgi:hypothetical protein